MSKSHNGVKESEECTYSGGPVPGSSGKKARRGTEIDADDRILVSLKHKLHRRRARVPELDAAVFATADDPLALVRDRDGEDEVLDPPNTVLSVLPDLQGRAEIAPYAQ